MGLNCSFKYDDNNEEEEEKKWQKIEENERKLNSPNAEV